MSKISYIPPMQVIQRRFAIKNVAAYCRVSTKAEVQSSSLDLQISYYTDLIKQNPNWHFAGIYADNGSGRNTKRKAFQQMLQDCLDGRIDLILTKSMSRLGRNTVDILNICRKFKERNIDIYFENENIYLSQQLGELYLTVYAAIFQNESIEKSENIKWGIRIRFADGTSGFINRPCYGYHKDKSGQLIIFEPEAETVRLIYQLHKQGLSLRQIAYRLYRRKIPAPKGGTEWHIETIRKILANEKYKGEVILQKTFVSDFFSGKQKLNKGELTRYLVKEVCKPIIKK